MRFIFLLILPVIPLFVSGQVKDPGKIDLNFRQIHLDFHNWGDFPDFLSRFDADEFAETLERAHVNSVTVMGRGAQGWIYYDSKKFPEYKHPNLDRDLLREQIKACHKRGIRVPIYLIIQCDEVTAKMHPEWYIIKKDGSRDGGAPYVDSFWKMLCVNSPYKEFLKAQTREVLENYPVDGLFFDIVSPRDCSCSWCVADMKKQGIDPNDDNARMKFARNMLHSWMDDMTDFVRSINTDCSIFFNSGHIEPRHRETIQCFTHFELESLPGGSWGYLHFPMTMRYARNLGLDCMAMTGKFHTSWGDFHSLKNQPALEYECFNALALGGKCSIGDQLHPNGKLDGAAYELIGNVYKQVEEKEPWCVGAVPVTEIGVFHPAEFPAHNKERTPKAAMGVTRMLQEGKYQFDFIDSQMDFGKYRVLILPDNIPVSPDLNNKIDNYLKNGGALIASFESGLGEKKENFTLESLGIHKADDGPLDQTGQLVRGKSYYRSNYAEYIIPSGDIGKELKETEYVLYSKGMDIEVEEADILLNKTKSYFDRTWEHYSSHRQTPSSGKPGGPAIVKNGNVIYFAHNVFSQYQQNGPIWYKKLVLNALDILLTEPVVRLNAPSTAEVTINEQPDENRYVIHFLHYIPQRRTSTIDIIEDVIPIYDVKASVKVPDKIKKVVLVPEMRSIDFELKKGRIEFVIPKVEGHQMVELKY